MELKAIRRTSFAILCLSVKTLISFLLFLQLILAVDSDFPFRNPSLPWDERVEVSDMLFSNKLLLGGTTQYCLH